ncbi:Regulator of microtubule dynamics protein 1 [Aphelenchoides fujianensis]|nr:Regulator of microtubule dynamics protein 1 [Aphelenchoides fujianensis]
MFRQAASAARKLVVGVGALQLGAATVALTDKQLSKKPEWYQTSVKRLEHALKLTTRYGWIENEAELNDAEDIFQRVIDLNNPEVTWRLSRVLVEKAALIKDPHKQAGLLHQAVDLARRAIDSGKGTAGAYKWYAIALQRLIEVDKAAKKKESQLNEKIWDSLKQATRIDPKDPFAWHLLGVAAFKKKDYKEAIGYFQQAENIKASSAHFGDKTAAIQTLKNALVLKTKWNADNVARSNAKSTLLSKLKQNAEQIDVQDAYGLI